MQLKDPGGVTQIGSRPRKLQIRSITDMGRDEKPILGLPLQIAFAEILANQLVIMEALRQVPGVSSEELRPRIRTTTHLLRHRMPKTAGDE